MTEYDTEGKPIWVARPGGRHFYDIYDEKPEWDERYGAFMSANGGVCLGSINGNDFINHVGIRVEPGECVKVRLLAQVWREE